MGKEPLFFYSKELVDESNKKGFQTINKEKDLANKATVVNIIQTKSPNFIMFNGHGNPNLICGHNNEKLIELGKNHDLLKNRIIYSLSCSSAAQLGKAVADENTVFVGYTGEFALGMDKRYQSSIHRDEGAKLFLEPSNILVKSILKGNKVKEAVTKAKELMKKNISLLRTNPPSIEAQDYLPYLFNNCICLANF